MKNARAHRADGHPRLKLGRDKIITIRIVEFAPTVSLSYHHSQMIPVVYDMEFSILTCWIIRMFNPVSLAALPLDKSERQYMINGIFLFNRINAEYKFRVRKFSSCICRIHPVSKEHIPLIMGCRWFLTNGKKRGNKSFNGYLFIWSSQERDALLKFNSPDYQGL